MSHINHEHRQLYWGFSIVALVLIGGGYYLYQQLTAISLRIDALSAQDSAMAADFASTTETLRLAIDDTRTSLSNSLSAQQQNVGAIQEKLGGFQSQVGDLSGTLNTLQKLSKTDPELLRKYSKTYFLNENYVPVRLSVIEPKFRYSDSKEILIHSDVLQYLESMINAASSEGIKIYAFSAYRSFPEQKALKSDYGMIYGAGTANSFSADQGYSEHQLGTAIDAISTGQGGVLEGFENTSAYKWMVKNAHKYGFILSYPEDNNYYVFEPWHWRFVGVKLATDLYTQGKDFYELDQRTIDKYLVNIFD